MSRVSPYYTISEEYPPSHRGVYHDRDDCHYGRDIRVEHRQEGIGKRPRCSRCLELSLTLPFHTTHEEYPPSHRNVYHDHYDCNYAREIKPEHRVNGTGGREHCARCAELGRVWPYHTDTEEYPPTHRDVYHDHDDCHYGRDIEPQHREEGDGGRPRCSRCTKLG